VQFSKPPGATVALSSIFGSFLDTDFRRCKAFISFEIGSEVKGDEEQESF